MSKVSPLDDNDGDEPTFQKIPKKPDKSPRHAMPGESEKSHRKAVPRGHPFSHKDSLPKWSTR